jgi:hypothetical protein
MNAELRLRSETSDEEGEGSVVAGAAEILRLDGPKRVKQVIEGWKKSVGKEASCSSTWDIFGDEFANRQAAAVVFR